MVISPAKRSRVQTRSIVRPNQSRSRLQMYSQASSRRRPRPADARRFRLISTRLWAWAPAWAPPLHLHPIPENNQSFAASCLLFGRMPGDAAVSPPKFSLSRVQRQRIFCHDLTRSQVLFDLQWLLVVIISDSRAEDEVVGDKLWEVKPRVHEAR